LIQSDYERLIEPIEDRMIGSIWRIVRDPDDADDAFQEALAKIWKSLPKILRHPNPQALILRICLNAAYDLIRKRTRLRQREEEDSIVEDFPDNSASAFERLLGQERERQIMKAIGFLPRRQAQAVLMRFVEDLSYGDIAQALGCAETTVRSHIAKARKQLALTIENLS